MRKSIFRLILVVIVLFCAQSKTFANDYKVSSNKLQLLTGNWAVDSIVFSDIRNVDDFTLDYWKNLDLKLTILENQQMLFNFTFNTQNAASPPNLPFSCIDFSLDQDRIYKLLCLMKNQQSNYADTVYFFFLKKINEAKIILEPIHGLKAKIYLSNESLIDYKSSIDGIWKQEKTSSKYQNEINVETQSYWSNQVITMEIDSKKKEVFITYEVNQPEINMELPHLPDFCIYTEKNPGLLTLCCNEEAIKLFDADKRICQSEYNVELLSNEKLVFKPESNVSFIMLKNRSK